MTERRTQDEKVYAALFEAGAFWLTAQQITEKTGSTRVAARVHTLKSKHKVGIESKFINREQGKSYRLTAVERERGFRDLSAPEPDDFTGSLFPDEQAPTHPQNAINDDYERAA